MSKKWLSTIGVVATVGIVWFITTYNWLPAASEDVVLESMDVDAMGNSSNIIRYLEETDVTIGPFTIMLSPFHLIYLVLSIGLISFALLFDLVNPFLCRCCSMLFSTLTKWKNS